MLETRKDGPGVEFYRTLPIYHLSHNGSRLSFQINNGELIISTYTDDIPCTCQLLRMRKEELISFLTFIDQQTGSDELPKTS